MQRNVVIAIVVIVIIVISAIVLGVVLGISDPTVTTTPTPLGTLHIINSKTSSLDVSLQLDATDRNSVWSIISGDGKLGEPVYNDNTQNPPNHQLVTLEVNQFLILNFPSTSIAWRVTPLSTTQGGKPILVECNRDVVCDMSAVDGVNNLLNMSLTASTGVSTIDFNTSPCSVPGQGCDNPSVDGIFLSGKTFSSAPCPYGTCNLDGASRAWCQAINTGQCANVDSTWEANSRAAACLATNPESYTSYCYSHNDQNSSPTLVAPYNVKLIYSDL